MYRSRSDVVMAYRNSLVTLSTTTILLVLLVIPSPAVTAKDMPDFIKVCRRSDPDINKCITNSVEELKPILEKGSEGFIPSLEPLLIKEILITEGTGLRIVGKDVKSYGSSAFNIFNMQADIDNLVFEFDLSFPMLYIVAEYDINGRVLLIPIKGSGPLYGNFTDCSAHVRLVGKHIEKDGGTYIDFTELKIKFTVSKGTVKLGNLFGGDKVLGDAVNSAINANFKQFLKELQNPIQKALEDSLLEISKDCVRDYTVEQLLPP